MTIPESGLSDLEAILGPDGVSTDPIDLLAYSRDVYPLALKYTPMDDRRFWPDAVVWPETTEEVSELVKLAAKLNVPLVPYGGGSGSVGGAICVDGGIIVDMKKMNRILEIDGMSMTVRVQAGMIGKPYEDELNQAGFTGGHFPQSLYSATVGGWIAHRGAGTFSTKYGKIDDMVKALTVVMPDGSVLRTRSLPASAAGFDLNRIFMGTEGILGITTEAVLQIYPLPEKRVHHSYAINSMAEGVEAVRRIVTQGYYPAVVRLYDPIEAMDQFGSLDIKQGQCILLFASEGEERLTDLTAAYVHEQVMGMDALDLGSTVGDYWFENRFSTASFCRTDTIPTGLADALEVANVWSGIAPMYEHMKANMDEVIGPNGRVYGHGSHFYHSGGNLYMIFHTFAEDKESLADQYFKVLGAAFDACHAEGGTLTHHHGVGLAKARWMNRELGNAGFALLDGIKKVVDPQGIINPGKLGLNGGNRD